MSTASDGDARSLQVAGFHHVAINVRDLDASIQFYVKLFGLTAGSRSRFRQVLRHGPLELHLFQAPEPDGAETPRNWAQLGIQHVAFALSAAELARAATLLTRLAVGVDGPVQDTAGQALYLRDPDGNVIELRAPV